MRMKIEIERLRLRRKKKLGIRIADRWRMRTKEENEERISEKYSGRRGNVWFRERGKRGTLEDEKAETGMRRWMKERKR